MTGANHQAFHVTEVSKDLHWENLVKKVQGEISGDKISAYFQETIEEISALVFQLSSLVLGLSEKKMSIESDLLNVALAGFVADLLEIFEPVGVFEIV